MQEENLNSILEARAETLLNQWVKEKTSIKQIAKNYVDLQNDFKFVVQTNAVASQQFDYLISQIKKDHIQDNPKLKKFVEALISGERQKEIVKILEEAQNDKK